MQVIYYFFILIQIANQQYLLQILFFVISNCLQFVYQAIARFYEGTVGAACRRSWIQARQKFCLRS